MRVCFCCVRFSFLVLSREIGWEERLQNNLFCIRWDVKPQLYSSFLAPKILTKFLSQLPVILPPWVCRWWTKQVSRVCLGRIWFVCSTSQSDAALQLVWRGAVGAGICLCHWTHHTTGLLISFSLCCSCCCLHYHRHVFMSHVKPMRPPSILWEEFTTEADFLSLYTAW